MTHFSDLMNRILPSGSHPITKNSSKEVFQEDSGDTMLNSLECEIISKENRTFESLSIVETFIVTEPSTQSIVTAINVSFAE